MLADREVLDGLYGKLGLRARDAWVRRRVAAWWEGLADRSGTQTVETYYGAQPLHEVLERTTWHSAQHARQVMSLLEQQGIAPERPLGPRELQGLPVPSKLWDD